MDSRGRISTTVLIALAFSLATYLLRVVISETLTLALSPNYTSTIWAQRIIERSHVAVADGVLLGVIWAIVLLATTAKKPLSSTVRQMVFPHFLGIALFQLFWLLWSDHRTLNVLRWLSACFPTVWFALLTLLLWRRIPAVPIESLRCPQCGFQLLPCCSNCGYSLNGNESGICPECGVPVPDSQIQPSNRCP